MQSVFDIVVIGAGAAGIGAGRQLARAGVSFTLAEARSRIGGRASTVAREHPLDLGCGWLHSAELNVWTMLAAAHGFEVDRTPAPWQRQSGEQGGFSDSEQLGFAAAFRRFEERIEREAEKAEPMAASAYLEPGGRYNPLIDNVFSFISGAALDDIDARDYARYEDTGKNWRVRDGYGALIAAHGADLPALLETEVRGLDHSGATVRIDTTRGALEARAVIVTLPTAQLARLPIQPDLPEVREAALGLPLGKAEKVHFALADPEQFPKDGHLFARTDTRRAGSYHLRPFGRPLIEGYFGGELAAGLAEAGAAAMADYALSELAGLIGSSFPKRLSMLAASSWATDPYSLGSYSYARPGFADARATLARPHAGRIFIAGEACSRDRYSTAHGAYQTGHEAAERALSVLA